jgi:uncharacterized protein with GYD domain
MAHYLVQVSYIGSVIESLGGRMESFFHAFGDYDAVAIAELPDNASAAAFAWP